jgi:hypothetical protein
MRVQFLGHPHADYHDAHGYPRWAFVGMVQDVDDGEALRLLEQFPNAFAVVLPEDAKEPETASVPAPVVVPPPPAPQKRRKGA